MLHGKNEGIQLLRAVLFLGIIAFHSNVPYTQMLWGGVEFFFIISSYFLTLKLVALDKVNIKSIFFIE